MQQVRDLNIIIKSAGVGGALRKRRHKSRPDARLGKHLGFAPSLVGVLSR
jgi:hypothetical protein